MGKVENLIESLFDVGAVKFGKFTLKSGIISPIYFDLRVIISYPGLMKRICEILEEELVKFGGIDVLCGVPYTALPLATIVSVNRNIPMIIKRKEQKKYGTGKLIEGEYEGGKTKCLILEDVVTTGSSVIETTEALRAHGILVDRAVVVLNRNYPAADENLKKNGVTLESLVKVDKLLEVLLESGRISPGQKVDVEEFLKNGQTIPCPAVKLNGEDKPKLFEKAKKSLSDVVDKRLIAHGRQLMEIILKKETNLCLAADCKDWRQVLEVTEAVGNKICAVKTHIDAINFADFQEISTFQEKLLKLAKANNFLIIEDRKFADIGATVEKQLTAEPFSIGKWANMVTVHSIPGPGILKVFKEMKVGAILIAEMSSAGNLPALIPEYKSKTLEMCYSQEETVVGFVSQSRVGGGLTSSSFSSGEATYLQFTPGVSLEKTGDSLGQQYVSVKEAVIIRDADVIIVGRGIIGQKAEEWEATAEKYRKEGWEALLEKVASSLQ